MSGSYNDQLQPGSNLPQITGIAGEDRLPGPLRTNGDMSIDDI
jgi:hypothetical protein